MWRQNLNVGNGFLERLEDVFVEDAAAAKKKKKKKDKMDFLQMRFALTCSKTQVLTDDTCLLSFYLFEFTTQETITAKNKHFVFF